MASVAYKTASTHRSAVVRGTHEFHIVGCSGRKRFAGVTSSSPVKSAFFLAGGHTWTLACSFDDEGHLASIAIELICTTKDVVAMATIRIEDPLGEWPSAVWRSDAHRFQPSKSRGSWELSVPDAYHGHESRYVRDDRLTIECTVEVLEEHSPAGVAVETRNCFVSVVPPPTLTWDLHNLLLLVDKLESGSSEERRRRCMQPDVTFVVEETEIQAHKLVLAMRSPVFAAEFRWHTTNNPCLLSVDDMTASTFRAMLRFIYTDELPIKAASSSSSSDAKERACKQKYASRRREAMARDLLVAADRYDLERLRLMCQNILFQSIDTSNVMGTLSLVRGRDTCRQLEDSCIEYIASDPEVFAFVMATEEYQELKNSCSPLIIEIMERVATQNAARRSSSEGLISHRLPKKTWSTHKASEEVHGVHEFRIPNFCAVIRLVDNQTIHSGTFRVGDYDWKLVVCCPSSGGDGETTAEAWSMSVYLKLLSDPPSHGVEVSKKFMVYNPSGKPPMTLINDGAAPTTYRERGQIWGYKNLITLESAKSQYLAHDGSLTICCDFAVTKQPYTSRSIPTTRPMIAVPSSSIALHLDQLLLAGEQGADVRFLVEGSEICAHSLVIAARCPVLYEVVAAAAGDSEDCHIVRINGMKATVFKAVLRCVYTDDELANLGRSVVVDEDMVAAASRFGLERMKIICENFLAEHISKENAFDTWNVARRHQCSKLEDYCMDFILSVPSLAKELIKLIPLPSS